MCVCKCLQLLQIHTSIKTCTYTRHVTSGEGRGRDTSPHLLFAANIFLKSSYKKLNFFFSEACKTFAHMDFCLSTPPPFKSDDAKCMYANKQRMEFNFFC